jgi:xylan 1,4-beta-xylosidase
MSRKPRMAWLAVAVVLCALAAAQRNPYTGSGTSGPGRPVEGNGWNVQSAPLVGQGLLPPLKPLLDAHMRDTYITRGGDGNYYMTGTTGEDPSLYNDGVELWQSRDLRDWKYLGVVWSIDDDATWQRTWRLISGKQVRAVRAPEIHYIRGNYVICLSMLSGGIAILRSRTGKPQGPYMNTLETDRPLARGVDPTLFEDSDGSVYFTYGGAGYIVRLRDDLSDLAEPYHLIEIDDPDHNPDHHAARCAERGRNDIGYEGAVLFRANGKYYLGAADTYDGRYSMCLAVADRIYGPYRKRREAVPGGGGAAVFQDRDGAWWSTYFGNDAQSPFREKPAAVRIEFDKDGLVHVARNQPKWLLADTR